MKNTGIIIVSLLMLLIISGCDDTFEPKTDYEPVYILTCMVKGDSSDQMVMVAKTYDVDGYVPTLNTTDPVIQDAEVTFTTNDYSLTMLDTLVFDQYYERYDNPLHLFYLSEIVPQPNNTIEITAKLSDGTMLSGTTVMPQKLYVQVSNTNINTSDDDLYGKSFTCDWTGGVLGQTFIPKIEIPYYKVYDDSVSAGRIQVPLKYEYIDGKSVPIYPNITNGRGLVVEYPAFDSAMVNLSAGDNDKFSYIVNKAELIVMVYDEHLSKYYSSTHGYLDDYSVRLDETVYTNIEGGMGVIGSYMVTKKNIGFDIQYVQSFGYRFR